MDTDYDVIAFILKYLYFDKACGRHFTWHHQNVTSLLKQSLKAEEKLKELEILLSIHVFLDIGKFSNFRWKIADISLGKV